MAVSWLRRPASRSGPGCLVAVSESANWINGEIPDAIGWRPYKYGRAGSVIVEAKISRSDFLADANKSHRIHPGKGMGSYRYYLAPAGIIKVDELPAKWGLIEVNHRGHLKVLAGHVLLMHQEPDCWRHEQHDMAAEIGTLAQCLNRVGDPQRLQETLRDANNRNIRLLRQLDHLEQKNRDLCLRLAALRA